MRNISKPVNGYTLYAVSGTNTVSFAIDFDPEQTLGLLGFGVIREEHFENKPPIKKDMPGYKVFEEIIPDPNELTKVSTMDHPVQSFFWDDFTCNPNRNYIYYFHPIKGSPNDLDHSQEPIMIEIKTEPLFSTETHDIFFNRGVASSQAYNRRFKKAPDDITDPQKKAEALEWLSRSLDEAIIKFIKNAQKGDTLLGCFYEFHFEPVVTAFKEAIERGVQVKLIVDGKNNGYTDKKKKDHASFPRLANIKALTEAGISTTPEDGIVILRASNKNDIQHNKFIVLKRKGNKNFSEVWTGSTNISDSGIHGQTNVGHWIREKDTAIKYAKYWKILAEDPGKADDDDRATGMQKNEALKESIETLHPNFEFDNWDNIPQGITPIFSPRSTSQILTSYVNMFDSAENFSCVTLAFGINKLFKDYVKDNTNKDHLSFMLLEKEDVEKEGAKTPFLHVGAKQNVYKAWGSFINDPLYNWTRELTTRSMNISEHVAYIHSKFMLIDPLSNDPVVITGSANFSDASTNSNDENMVIIRGDRRTADIYYTEFNRLFNHYYFRAVYNKAKENEREDHTQLLLSPNDSWLEKYQEGKFRYKRIQALKKMVLF